MKRFSWNQYFMTIAYAVSMKSKDPSTKVGCVIVGDDNEILSTGYNGFARGVDDSRMDRFTSEEKYKWIVCGERNAVYNAARNGTDLEDAVLYTNLFPCAECAKAIVQSGIKEVIVHKTFSDNYLKQAKLDKSHLNISETILKEGRVKITLFTGEIIDLVGLIKGNPFEL